MNEDAEAKRGTGYADGGVASVRVFYPDPAKIQACHAEWDSDEHFTKEAR